MFKKSNFKIIVIGAGRGGTSLLASMIDSHSKIDLGFEQFAINSLVDLDYNDRVISSNDKVIQTRTKKFIDLCEEESKNHTSVWGNKITTEHILALDDHNVVNRENPIGIMEYSYKSIFKNKKIIFITRNGQDCVSSKVNRTGQSYELAIHRWIFSIKLLKFLKSKKCSIISIKFEDLIKNPGEITKDIFDFLKVEYEDVINKSFSNNVLPEEYRHGKIDKSTINKHALPKVYRPLIDEWENKRLSL